MKRYFIRTRDFGNVVHMIIRSVQLDWQSVLILAVVAGFFDLTLIPLPDRSRRLDAMNPSAGTPDARGNFPE